jgi:hypothetical protein
LSIPRSRRVPCRQLGQLLRALRLLVEVDENANFPKPAALPGLDRQHDIFQSLCRDCPFGVQRGRVLGDLVEGLLQVHVRFDHLLDGVP